MCAIHLAAMVHIIYTLTENKTPILRFFIFITASLAARCDSKLLPDHSKSVNPFVFPSEPIYTVHRTE